MHIKVIEEQLSSSGTSTIGVPKDGNQDLLVSSLRSNYLYNN